MLQVLVLRLQTADSIEARICKAAEGKLRRATFKPKTFGSPGLLKSNTQNFCLRYI